MGVEKLRGNRERLDKKQQSAPARPLQTTNLALSADDASCPWGSAADTHARPENKPLSRPITDHSFEQASNGGKQGT